VLKLTKGCQISIQFVLCRWSQAQSILSLFQKLWQNTSGIREKRPDLAPGTITYHQTGMWYLSQHPCFKNLLPPHGVSLWAFHIGVSFLPLSIFHLSRIPRSLWSLRRFLLLSLNAYVYFWGLQKNNECLVYLLVSLRAQSPDLKIII